MPTDAKSCRTCGVAIWRTIVHPKLGEQLLWPNPTALFGRVWAGEGPAVGLGYCADCAPPLGHDADLTLIQAISTANGSPVSALAQRAIMMGYEDARSRYSYRMSDGYGQWLKAWLAQECGFGEVQIDAIMDQWRADRDA